MVELGGTMNEEKEGILDGVERVVKGVEAAASVVLWADV